MMMKSKILIKREKLSNKYERGQSLFLILICPLAIY